MDVGGAVGNELSEPVGHGMDVPSLAAPGGVDVEGDGWVECDGAPAAPGDRDSFPLVGGVVWFGGGESGLEGCGLVLGFPCPPDEEAGGVFDFVFPGGHGPYGVDGGPYGPFG